MPFGLLRAARGANSLHTRPCSLPGWALPSPAGTASLPDRGKRACAFPGKKLPLLMVGKQPLVPGSARAAPSCHSVVSFSQFQRLKQPSMAGFIWKEEGQSGRQVGAGGQGRRQPSAAPHSAPQGHKHQKSRSTEVLMLLPAFQVVYCTEIV